MTNLVSTCTTLVTCMQRGHGRIFERSSAGADAYRELLSQGDGAPSNAPKGACLSRARHSCQLPASHRPRLRTKPHRTPHHATSRLYYNVRNHAAGVDGCPIRVPCKRRPRPSQPRPLRWLLSWPQIKSSPVNSSYTSSRVKSNEVKSSQAESSQIKSSQIKSELVSRT